MASIGDGLSAVARGGPLVAVAGLLLVVVPLVYVWVRDLDEHPGPAPSRPR